MNIKYMGNGDGGASGSSVDPPFIHRPVNYDITDHQFDIKSKISADPICGKSTSSPISVEKLAFEPKKQVSPCHDLLAC